MQKPTRREWLGLLLAPLVAAAFTAAALHILSQPSSHTFGRAIRISSGVQGWSFRETFPQLLPTLIAFSFVYHLTILPYIRSHNRRCSLVLTALAGPFLAVWIFAVSLFLATFIYPGALASFWKSLVAVVTDPYRAFHSPAWFFLITGIAAVFTVFTVSAAFLASRQGTPPENPRISPDAAGAARGCVLGAAVLLPLVYVWFTELKQGSDRAGCILSIRNVQQATRSHNGLHGINPNEPGFSKNSIIGPGNFIEKEPVCPGGGIYTWIQNRTPRIGELMMRCSIPGHNPENHYDW